jgi:hypothetical protein
MAIVETATSRIPMDAHAMTSKRQSILREVALLERSDNGRCVRALPHLEERTHPLG